MKIRKQMEIAVVWIAVIVLNAAAFSRFITNKQIFVPTTAMDQFANKPDAPLLSIFCLIVSMWLTSDYVSRNSLIIASIILTILFFIGVLFMSLAFGIVISIMAGFTIRRLKNDFPKSSETIV